MWVVDGDEIYWKDIVEEIRNILDTLEPDVLGRPFISCRRDIYHYRDGSRELYLSPDGRGNGAYTCHIFSMSIKGLHCDGGYGVEGQRDDAGDIRKTHDPLFTKELNQDYRLMKELTKDLKRERTVNGELYQYSGVPRNGWNRVPGLIFLERRK